MDEWLEIWIKKGRLQPPMLYFFLTVDFVGVFLTV
jgi:hypothetical protein